MKAFTVMGRTIKAVYDELFLCVFLSLLWWLGTIIIVTAAPVSLGLHNVANRMANYKRVDSSMFFEAAKSHFGKGWLLYLMRLVVPLLVGANIWFYFNLDNWMWLIGVLFAWLLFVSLMISLYIFPLFYQQDETSLKMVLRNAVILTMQHPLYTFLLMLFMGVFVALSIIPIIALFLTPAVIAVAMNFGLNGMLQEIGMAPEPPVINSRR